jgi:hypothetical protein
MKGIKTMIQVSRLLGEVSSLHTCFTTGQSGMKCLRLRMQFSLQLLEMTLSFK